jgi:hypothetical protein
MPALLKLSNLVVSSGLYNILAYIFWVRIFFNVTYVKGILLDTVTITSIKHCGQVSATLTSYLKGSRLRSLVETS